LGVAENHRLDFEYVQASLRDVRLPMGLVVDSVKVEAEGVQLQTEPFVAKVRTPGTLEVFVGDQNLEAFLNQRQPGGLRNFVVRATHGQLEIQASMVKIIELRATAICTLRIVGGRQLWVDVQSVQIMGAGATSLVQSLLQNVNPVLDVEEFPIRASLDSVTIGEGGVILHGTVAPP
jgi:hypothetical protein